MKTNSLNNVGPFLVIELNSLDAHSIVGGSFQKSAHQLLNQLQTYFDQAASYMKKHPNQVYLSGMIFLGLTTCTFACLWRRASNRYEEQVKECKNHTDHLDKYKKACEDIDMRRVYPDGYKIDYGSPNPKSLKDNARELLNNQKKAYVPINASTAIRLHKIIEVSEHGQKTFRRSRSEENFVSNLPIALRNGAEATIGKIKNIVPGDKIKQAGTSLIHGAKKVGSNIKDRFKNVTGMFDEGIMTPLRRAQGNYDNPTNLSHEEPSY